MKTLADKADTFVSVTVISQLALVISSRQFVTSAWECFPGITLSRDNHIYKTTCAHVLRQLRHSEQS